MHTRAFMWCTHVRANGREQRCKDAIRSLHPITLAGINNPNLRRRISIPINNPILGRQMEWISPAYWKLSSIKIGLKLVAKHCKYISRITGLHLRVNLFCSHDAFISLMTTWSSNVSMWVMSLSSQKTGEWPFDMFWLHKCHVTSEKV